MDLTKVISEGELQQQQEIKQYYQFQSKIYDLTRWAFLFGRLGILKKIAFQKSDSFHMAEIGCGTGFNLNHLAKQFPRAKFTGVDVSEEMVNIARHKLGKYANEIKLHNLPYGLDSTFLKPTPDIILFSYSLSMINPQWEDLIEKAYEDLAIGGKIMVVDFYHSKFPFFKNHMANHHVRMDEHILPVLKKHFKTNYSAVKSAYGGLWEYFMFIGEK